MTGETSRDGFRGASRSTIPNYAPVFRWNQLHNHLAACAWIFECGAETVGNECLERRRDELSSVHVLTRQGPVRMWKLS